MLFKEKTIYCIIITYKESKKRMFQTKKKKCSLRHTKFGIEYNMSWEVVKWRGRGLCRLDSVLNEKRDQAEGTRLSLDSERKRKNEWEM